MRLVVPTMVRLVVRLLRMRMLLVAGPLELPAVRLLLHARGRARRIVRRDGALGLVRLLVLRVVRDHQRRRRKRGRGTG